jgi:hypothetical protein
MSLKKIGEAYSTDRVRLASVVHWRGADDAHDLSSIGEISAAYNSGRGVVWIHWEVSTVGLEARSPEARDIRDAVFLEDFLGEAFNPKPGDAVDRIIRWRLNLVSTAARGGLHSFEEEGEEVGDICMFDSDVFGVGYIWPEGELTAKDVLPMIRDSWQRVLLPVNTITAIAAPGLAVTIRNVAAPAYFDELAAVNGLEDEEEEEPPLRPEWRWSDAAIKKSFRRSIRTAGSVFGSGDLLAVLADECVEAYEEPRSWLQKETEEVEVARLAPDLVGHDIDQVAFARRHAWLLQQASRIRAALDWGRADRDLPEDLFCDPEILKAMEDRRLAMLAALTEVRSTLRSALDLVATSSSAEQLELSRSEAARSSAFQSAITFVTAVLLAPALVAAVFGAMPGVLADYPSRRFEVIVISMVLAGAVSFLAIRATRGQGVGRGKA